MRTWLLAALTLASTAAYAAPPAAAPGSEGPASGDSSARAGDSIPPASASALNDADTQAAKKVLTDYLNLVIKKKYAEANKLVHPKTLALIAGIKKRLGEAQHPMAPSYWAKNDFRLVSYTFENASNHRWGTIAFDVKEVDYRIQEKGEDQGNQVSYLLGKSGGTWFVVDKMDNNTFSDNSIKFDYKGYFDAKDPAPAPQADGE